MVVTQFRGAGMVTVLFPVAPGRHRFDPRWLFCAIGWLLTRCSLASVARGGWASGCVWGPGLPVTGEVAGDPLSFLSRPPGPARRLLRIWSASAAVPPPASGARGQWGGRLRRSFTAVRSPLWATAEGDCVTTPVSMAPCRVSGVLRSVSSAALPWGGGGGAGLGEAEAGSCVINGPRRLTRSPDHPLFLLFTTDRCGDFALSWAGPKPRQARDGHSWRMGPLFSSCPRVPRLSSLPVGGVWKAGVRNPAPTSLWGPLT